MISDSEHAMLLSKCASMVRSPVRWCVVCLTWGTGGIPLGCFAAYRFAVEHDVEPGLKGMSVDTFISMKQQQTVSCWYSMSMMILVPISCLAFQTAKPRVALFIAIERCGWTPTYQHDHERFCHMVYCSCTYYIFIHYNTYEV